MERIGEVRRTLDTVGHQRSQQLVAESEADRSCGSRLSRYAEIREISPTTSVWHTVLYYQQGAPIEFIRLLDQVELEDGTELGGSLA
jgi:hypothetical protein